MWKIMKYNKYNFSGSAMKCYNFSWSAIQVLTTATLTLILTLKWKPTLGYLKVKTCIMLKPVNWLLLKVKWAVSTWHKITLNGAFEQILQLPELLKIAENALKLLKSLLKALLW